MDNSIMSSNTQFILKLPPIIQEWYVLISHGDNYLDNASVFCINWGLDLEAC